MLRLHEEQAATFKFWDAFPDHQSPSAVRGYLLRGGVTRIAFMALRPRFRLSMNMAHQELQASSLLGETAFFLAFLAFFPALPPATLNSAVAPASEAEKGQSDSRRDPTTYSFIMPPFRLLKIEIQIDKQKAMMCHTPSENTLFSPPS